MLQMLKHRSSQFALYALLKEQGGIAFDSSQCWLVSNPALIKQLLSEPTLMMTPTPVQDIYDPDLQSVLALLSRQILQKDGEPHERLKSLMQMAMQRQFNLLRSEIDRHIDHQLENLALHATWDLVGDFAQPLAHWVMASLVGLAEEPMERLYCWGQSLADVTSGRLSRVHALRHVLEMQAVCLLLVRERRTSPQEDLLSAFTLQVGWRSDEELVDNAMTIFGAGISTIPKAITHSMLFLQEDPKKAYRIERLLCQATPTRYITRWSSTSLRVGNHLIEKGQQIYLLLEAANLDIASIDCKQHLAFGLAKNPHYCLGASLARYVLRRATSQLLARFPHLHIVETSGWGDNPNLSGISSMKVITGEIS